MKRMLAYSSVSHAGFMLIAIVGEQRARRDGAPLLPDPVLRRCRSARSRSSRRASASSARRSTLDDLAGFGWERPLLGVAMWVFMLGFAGLPLTGGFVGKFYVFAAAYEAGWTWLVIVGVVATAVSLYYYLDVVRALYMRSALELRGAAAAGGSPPRELLLQASVVGLPRRHGRLVLRRAAADRPGARRGRARCRF